MSLSFLKYQFFNYCEPFPDNVCGRKKYVCVGVYRAYVALIIIALKYKPCPQLMEKVGDNRHIFLQSVIVYNLNGIFNVFGGVM